MIKFSNLKDENIELKESNDIYTKEFENLYDLISKFKD